MHPDEIGESMKLLKQHIYKDRMKKELQKPATFIMKQIIEAKTCAESSKKQYRSNIDKFERFLKENEIPNTWESMNLDTINRYQKQIIKENPLHPHNTLRNIIDQYRLCHGSGRYQRFHLQSGTSPKDLWRTIFFRQ